MDPALIVTPTPWSRCKIWLTFEKARKLSSCTWPLGVKITLANKQQTLKKLEKTFLSKFGPQLASGRRRKRKVL